MMTLTKGQLILEDGTVFDGELFGAQKTIRGEVVFHTSMTGYQEILTDPAFFGQIIMFTAPTIGSYGINRDDFETITPFAKGLVVKELSNDPSNFRSEETLDSFLKSFQMTGIRGIDTRQLMRHIQEQGTMNGMITQTVSDTDRKEIVAQLKSYTIDQSVEQTSIAKPYVVPGRGQRIVLIDLGMKHGILRELTKRDCHITVVPYNYSEEKIIRLKPDGVLLSSGPGNPLDVQDTIKTVKKLRERLPMFGIGLGHQIIAIAFGATIEKSKAGYRGTSYPVKNLTTGKTVMTTQNNSYLVKERSLKETGLLISYRNLHDRTIAGLKHEYLPIITVQFYPEGSPGPEDSIHLFDDFLQLIEIKKREGSMHEKS